MAQGSRNPADPLADAEVKRARNLRQLLLRASRIVNKHVVEELQAMGYPELRPTHTTLLSNIRLAGGSVTDAADRAGITKQAMGRLASELEAAGYIKIASEPTDARVKLLRLTNAGRKLMADSLKVMTRLEERYADAIGKLRFADLQRGLLALISASDVN